ncbi:MAG TPA: AMP-binding protein, partial [Sporichthyaceae bacterium]
MNSSGHTQTYAGLDAASNRFAHAMRALRLNQGDRIAILLPNHPRYLEIVWGAQRSGLYYVPVNHHLRPAETAYVLEDCGARLLVGTADLIGAIADRTPWAGPAQVVVLDGDPPPGAHRYDDL